MKKFIKTFSNFNESEDNSQFFSDEGNMRYYIQIPEGHYESVGISDIIGKTIIDIVYSETSLVLECLDKDLETRVYYEFSHSQDCCESVWLDDIIGDLVDLIDVPVLKAEEKISSEDSDSDPKNGGVDDSHTWTFYTLATIKGYVDFRWFGTSNGYYSESVDISKITPNSAYGIVN